MEANHGAPFVITTDSTADLPEEFCRENGIGVLFIPYTLDGVSYDQNSVNLPITEFYAKVRAGSMPQTAQITPVQAIAAFEEYLNAGKDVLHLSFSSALSGCYASCCLAAEELKERYPERKIIVIDTLCASLGEGLMVYYARQRQKSGMGIDEVAQYVEDTKGHLCHYFTVDDLMHLYRGGRVSRTAAMAGSVLNIKPVLHVDDEGRLIPLYKVQGRKRSLKELVNNMVKLSGNWDNSVVFISHGDCQQDAEYVRQMVMEKFPAAKTFIVNHIGVAVGTHSGPGTVALFFLGDAR